MLENWPLYYAKELIVGNPARNVALCTLWTPRQWLAAALGKGQYAVCGNLYSLWGINFLLRNVLANPHIRYILLCGADRSGSGQALLDLVAQGTDDRHRISGSKPSIDPQIPTEAVEMFRQSVQIIDLRGVAEPAQLSQHMEHLPPLPPFGPPQVFPEAQPQVSTAPSEATGFRVENETVAGGYLQILKLVMEFGQVKPSEYAPDQKELLNVTAVITAENPDEPFFAPWLPFSREELESYYPQVLAPQVLEPQAPRLGPAFGPASPAPPSPGAIPLTLEPAYTYGERLRNYRGAGHDQIAAIIQRLKETGYTRRAIAVTWDPLVDRDSAYPPCLVALLTSIQREQLYLSAQFRSHDIYGAWPANAFALRKLQSEIAAAVGVALGPLTILSHSAHIYADKWESAKEILGQYYPKALAWRDDPRGNFLIRVEGKGNRGKIVAEHATTLEGKTGRRYEGRTAHQIYSAIVNDKLVSLPEHAAYLGSELQKAEVALRLGLDYRQDRPLRLKVSRPPKG